MIDRIQLIRNVGQFDSVNGAANIRLQRLTLIYAENGRGKTTLAAILRSLGANDPLLINERARLGAQHPPHVVLDCVGGPPNAMFQNGAWNRHLPDVIVFDDYFVDQNVCSGLEVGSGHRQNMHELILGAQGIALNRRLQELVEQIEVHNRELKAKGGAIPAAERGPFSVDDFCNLPPRADIDDAIREAERQLAAAREQDPVRETPEFVPLTLPAVDRAAIEAILSRDLPTVEADSLARVQEHLARAGRGAEAWVADGMSRVRPAAGGVSECPFCAQDLAGSPMLSHYRAYFSQEYGQLKRSVEEAASAFMRTHGGDAPAAFERAVRVAVERRQFWTRFSEVPEVALDTATIARDWRTMRDAIAGALEAKRAAPLERMTLSEAALAAIDAWEQHRASVAALSDTLLRANEGIRLAKQRAVAANAGAIASDLARLRATRARHQPGMIPLCQAYSDERAAKTVTETARDQARDALDQYRTRVFPAYEARINCYLGHFAAGFRLGSMTSANTRGGSACTYSVVINNNAVPVGSGTTIPGSPSFRSTLSAGDRNTLALAFFFASLDLDPDVANRIVVIDDPMTSLDEHRSLTTVQEVRGLLRRVRQVIALSHSRNFLSAIWQNADHAACTSLTVVDSPPGSGIQTWAIADDTISEYDRQHRRLREYRPGNMATSRLVAQDLRHVLEGFLRRCCPAYFLPGEVLGDLRRRIRDLPADSPPILTPGAVAELDLICEFANKYHHTTNLAWETEPLNETQLQHWIGRVLIFVGK